MDLSYDRLYSCQSAITTPGHISTTAMLPQNQGTEVYFCRHIASIPIQIREFSRNTATAQLVSPAAQTANFRSPSSLLRIYLYLVHKIGPAGGCKSFTLESGRCQCLASCHMCFTHTHTHTHCTQAFGAFSISSKGRFDSRLAYIKYSICHLSVQLSC